MIRSEMIDVKSAKQELIEVVCSKSRIDMRDSENC